MTSLSRSAPQLWMSESELILCINCLCIWLCMFVYMFVYIPISSLTKKWLFQINKYIEGYWLPLLVVQ